MNALAEKPFIETLPSGVQAKLAEVHSQRVQTQRQRLIHLQTIQ